MSLPGVGAVGSGTRFVRSSLRRERLGERLVVERRGRHAHARRLGDVGVAHREAHARRLQHQMEAIRPERIELRQIEVFQDVERHQRGEALRVRRNLDEIDAAIVGRDRRHAPRRDAWRNPRRVSTEPSALSVADHVLGDRAFVERARAVLGDRLQASRPAPAA